MDLPRPREPWRRSGRVAGRLDIPLSTCSTRALPSTTRHDAAASREAIPQIRFGSNLLRRPPPERNVPSQPHRASSETRSDTDPAVMGPRRQDAVREPRHGRLSDADDGAFLQFMPEGSREGLAPLDATIYHVIEGRGEPHWRDDDRVAAARYFVALVGALAHQASSDVVLFSF